MTLPLTAEFTVKSFRTAGQKPNPHGGTFDKYYVDLIDPEGKPVRDAQGKTDGAYWQRQSPSEVNEGEAVYGTVSEGEYGLRFKMEKRPDGGGTSSSGGGDYARRSGSGKSPDQQASIVRQHSQEMAIRLLTAMPVESGVALLEQEHGAADAKPSRTLQSLIDWFAADADAAQTASGAGGAGGLASPTSASPPQASDTQGVHERIQELLEAAGVNWIIAQSLRSYAMEELLPEKQDEIIEALQDDGRRDKCIEWLKGAYEKVKGSLPEPADDDDSVPF